jgi:hypothetical protein
MKRKRIYRFHLEHYRLSIIFAMLVLLGLTLLNIWLFNTFFHRSYFSWYVKAGPLIGLVSAVAATALGGLDKDSGFISKNPYEYLGSYFQLVGITFLAFATMLSSKSHTKRPSIFDSLIGVAFMIIYFVTAMVWLIVIIPCQYFVFLICGSIPRLALNSSTRLVAWFDGKQLKYDELPVSTAIRSDGWDATMRDNSFKVTSAFSAAFLFLLGPLLG